MWTLAQARSRLTGRLGEVSTAFWSNQDRNEAINDAQRFIAGLTKGVSSETSNSFVSVDSPSINLPQRTIEVYGPVARTEKGVSLSAIPIDQANAIDPNWRSMVGSPKWVVMDMALNVAWVVPAPLASALEVVTLSVSVIPAETSTDSDYLFDGVTSMDVYLGALLNMAAFYCLLRERYDGDAERFFGFATQELQAMGINPGVIPTYKEAAGGPVEGK